MSLKKFSVGEKRLMAEFVANIGVAWFAAGVINLFSVEKTMGQVFISLMWGVVFSIGFLRLGMYLVRGVES
jgi:hypothetical protein